MITNFMEILGRFYENATLGISPVSMLVKLCMALLVSLLIYLTYRKTYSGVSYAKSFNVSLIITTLVATMAMMMLQGSLILSLGTLGALSIIRFRNALKDSKDIVYMFWAIIAGLCTGTGAHVLAIVGSIFIALVLFIFSSQKENYMTYLLVIKGSKIDNEQIIEIINKHTKRSKVKTKNIDVIQVEYMYEIYLKSNSDEKLLNDIQNLSGIEKVNIIAYNSDLGM